MVLPPNQRGIQPIVEVAETLDYIAETPLLVLHARQDRVIRPEAAMIAYNQVNSTEKQLLWLGHSGHALLSDVEANEAPRHTKAFLARRLAPTKTRKASDP